jgi:hypothetical protein
MSDNHLWNPVLESDKSASGDLTRDRAERPDMCRLGSGHIWEISLKPG